MHFYAYIIFSPSTGKVYKGHTEDLNRRIEEHNSGKTKSIKYGIPWELIYYEQFTTRTEAIAREKYFKTAAGRRFIKNKIGF